MFIKIFQLKCFLFQNNKLSKHSECYQFNDRIIDGFKCFFRARNYKKSAGNYKSSAANFKIMPLTMIRVKKQLHIRFHHMQNLGKCYKNPLLY